MYHAFPVPELPVCFRTNRLNINIQIMETTFKRFVVAGMVMTGMVFGNAGFVRADGGIKDNPLTETKEHRSIETHIRTIESQHASITSTKACIKEMRAEKNTGAVAANQLELRRTKADLKREKAYLKADKKVLLANRKTEIRQKRQEKLDCKYALLEAKFLLRKDLRKGNTDRLKEDAERVAILTKEANALTEDEFTLRDERNEYVLYINEEINHTKGENLAVTASENTLARLDHLFLG